MCVHIDKGMYIYICILCLYYPIAVKDDLETEFLLHSLSRT